MEKRTTIGILAHVDAGKTTLAEAMLYRCGAIRKAGRVDHGDAHMDTHSLERARGITIFASQAQLQLGDWKAALLDTPGHVDFSAEMERTLWVLDYAILVINGADGVQAHVRTLWKLLKKYRIPVFLFVNKMDQPGTDRMALLTELKGALDGRCVDFTADRAEADICEDAAVCDEALLEQFLEQGTLSTESIAHKIRERKIYPCYFGSALKDEGVQEFLDAMARYMERHIYPTEFGARVYKIGRDEQGSRLSYLKVTGGSLKVKQLIQGETDGEAWEEKADQIRLYSGGSFENVQEVSAGTICAVTGLSRTGNGRKGPGSVPGTGINLPVTASEGLQSA